MRTSRDEYRDGKLWNGYNYEEQKWYYEGKPDTRSLEEIREKVIYDTLDKMIDELYLIKLIK